jgi:hypothetical protein
MRVSTTATARIVQKLGLLLVPARSCGTCTEGVTVTGVDQSDQEQLQGWHSHLRWTMAFESNASPRGSWLTTT